MDAVQQTEQRVEQADRPGTEPAVLRSEIKELLAGRLLISASALDERATLEALGLDSLLLTETVAALENRYAVHLDVVTLAEQLAPVLPLSHLVDELARNVRTAAC